MFLTPLNFVPVLVRSRRLVASGLALSLLGACSMVPPNQAPLDANTTVLLHAQGRNPSPWHATVTGNTLNWSGGELEFSLPARPQSSPLGIAYVGGDPNHVIEIWARDSVCHDESGPLPFPDSVQVRVDDKRFYGCGGDPQMLLQARWRVRTLSGKALPDQAAYTLEFDEFQRVRVQTPCGTFGSHYALSADHLTLTAFGGGNASACAAAEQESSRQLVRLLETTSTFDIRADKYLLLKAVDGAAVEAAP